MKRKAKKKGPRGSDWPGPRIKRGVKAAKKSISRGIYKLKKGVKRVRKKR
jgi:hypothetical protein